MYLPFVVKSSIHFKHSSAALNRSVKNVFDRVSSAIRSLAGTGRRLDYTALVAGAACRTHVAGLEFVEARQAVFESSTELPRFDLFAFRITIESATAHA